MSSEPINFRNLILHKVINESKLTKSITFQGEYNGQNAVVRLDKEPFEENLTRQALNLHDLDSERSLANDIYSRYTLKPPKTEISHVKAVVVIPANDTVLAKYSRSEIVFFTESPNIYEKTVEPFISNLLKSEPNCNQWIYNILNGSSEADNILYNDPDENFGFMLLPSINSSAAENELHILAICHRRDIRSLRDLEENHLQLLQNMHKNGTEIIEKKYGHLRGQLRSYIHYHPTFYHFHVHFEMVDPIEYKCSDRDNLLTTVINNISLMGDYYKRATLTYPLAKKNALFQELKDQSLIS